MDDLKLIKKYYGEKFMHLCRNLFPTILETEGLLFNILKEQFAYSKFLYNDLKEQNQILQFKDYIYSLIDVENKSINIVKTPKELLSDAGYILYECNSEEDIQSFKKYYEKNEKLCTFWGGRLKSCYVFFAVKKNVDEIKREDFPNPMRQDEYGTSVISIQFSRGNINTLSIKNRYNHIVNNPDATFSNNLDNIVPGLTKSFEDNYHFNINQNNNKSFELDGYVIASDGKYYKYNYEINNIYYCPNNIVIEDFKVKDEYLEKEKYLVIDYFVIDLVNKKIDVIDNKCNDSFLNELKSINKISIINKEQNKLIKISYKENRECLIEIDKQNRIISYKNDFIEEIDNYFLTRNLTLESISLPNVKEINDKFLYANKNLKEINLPKVKKIGNAFLSSNKNIKNINLPVVEKIGSRFLNQNNKILELNLPKVKEIGRVCLGYNNSIIKVNMPKVEKIEDGFLHSNKKLKIINLPKVKEIGSNFLIENECLYNINFPELKYIGDYFLSSIDIVKNIYLPKVKEIGDSFFSGTFEIENLFMPSIKYLPEYFLKSAKTISKINLNEVEKIDVCFLRNISNIEKLDFLPKVEEIGEGFITNCKNIKEVFLPNVKEIGEYFLDSSIDNIEYIYMPNLSKESIELLNLDKDIKRSRK